MDTFGFVVVATLSAVAIGLVIFSSEFQPATPVSRELPEPSGKSNVLAIVAFVLSFFASVPAIVCGHVALSQVSRTGDSGRGLAIASLWIGYVSLAALLVIVLFVLTR